MSHDGARCAEHPDRNADAGVCDRCGAFMCDECLGGASATELCVTCDSSLPLEGRAAHIRTLGALLIVNGALTTLGSAVQLFAIGTYVHRASGETWEEAGAAAAAVTTVAGVAVPLVAGLLQVVAGFGYRVVRRRSAGIVALVAGCLPIFGAPSCYAPTAIALAAYGLGYVRGPEVSDAFRRVARTEAKGTLRTSTS